MAVPTRMTFAVPAFIAGDTTRSIEIARAIREVGERRGCEAEIIFVYPRTTHTFGWYRCPIAAHSGCFLRAVSLIPSVGTL